MNDNARDFTENSLRPSRHVRGVNPSSRISAADAGDSTIQRSCAMNWRRFVPALVLLFAAECEAQNQLPRYHFEVGQELVYRGGSELKSDKITLSHRHSW